MEIGETTEIFNGHAPAAAASMERVHRAGSPIGGRN